MAAGGKRRVLMSWSGGKDSALALQRTIASSYQVAALVTTVTKEYDRISMHGVRRELLHAQASSLGIRLEEVWIPKNATNEEYERQMTSLLTKYRSEGVTEVVFGDLFLEDIRRYREERLERIGMTGAFPLWGEDTKALARRFVELGYKAVTCCVDQRRLDGSFCGVAYDLSFLGRLPADVDPCGENGEFHTFVWSGPIFRGDVRFRNGEVVLRDGFFFADLILG